MTPGFPESLFRSLAAAIDADVSFETEHSGPVLPDDPFRTGECDLGWVCSTSYVGLRAYGDAPSIELAGIAWVPDDPDAKGRPVYFGDLVVRSDSDIHTFEDLRSRTIGLNDPVSLSGNYALRFALLDRDEDPDTFAQLQFTGGHNTSLDRILDGTIDAASVDSVVLAQRATTDPRVAGLRVIERLGPWPTQPLVIRSGFDPGRAAEIRDRLLGAQHTDDIARELRKAGLLKLVAVDADHYEPVRKALAIAS